MKKGEFIKGDDFAYRCNVDEGEYVKCFVTRIKKYWKNCVTICGIDKKIFKIYLPKGMYEVGKKSDGIVEIMQHGKTRFVWVENDKEDKVLKQYGIHSDFYGFLLEFQSDDLVEIWGADKSNDVMYPISKLGLENRKNNGKPRILQAPIIALYTPGLITKGLKEKGYKADYMVIESESSGHFLETKPDFDLQCYDVAKYIACVRKIAFLIYAIQNYDIVHINSNWSLLGWSKYWQMNCDLPFLKKCGLKIVHSSWGYCDVRCIGEDNLGGISECDVCTQLRAVRCESEEYTKVICRTRENADIHLTNARAVPTYNGLVWVDNAICLENYEFSFEDIPIEYRIDKKEKVLIYHSFGNATDRDDVKGTKIVKEVVSRLQEEGYPIELMYFDKIAHKDIKFFQYQADIVIDQLYCGWYGSTGVECLALGKAVLTHVNPLVEDYVKNKLGRSIPVIDVDPDSLYDVLKNVLEHPELRREYEMRALECARKYHDYRRVTMEYEKIYQTLFDRLS